MLVTEQKNQSQPAETQTLPEAQSAKDIPTIDLINLCLFVPQAFLSRTPALTPAAEGHETEFQTFSRRLQELSENTSDDQLQDGVVDALQGLYTALNQEVAQAAPVTVEDWHIINAVLFSETMAKIQTQPEWVVAALLAPLAEKEAQYKDKI